MEVHPGTESSPTHPGPGGSSIPHPYTSNNVPQPSRRLALSSENSGPSRGQIQAEPETEMTWGPHRTTIKWTSEEAIIGLFNRCVQAATIHQAAQQFESITYSSSKGVQDYYSTLVRWASRMQNPPHSYDMKMRFVKGLPMSILELLIDRGITPEFAKLKTIVKAVTRIEDNCALHDYYVSGKRKPSSMSSKYVAKRTIAE